MRRQGPLVRSMIVHCPSRRGTERRPPHDWGGCPYIPSVNSICLSRRNVFILWVDCSVGQLERPSIGPHSFPMRRRRDYAPIAPNIIRESGPWCAQRLSLRSGRRSRARYMHGTRARLVRDCGIGRILAICSIEVLIDMRLLEGRVGFALRRRCVSKRWGLRAPTTSLDGTCDGLDFLLAGLWVIWRRLASLHSYRGDLNSERVTLPCSRDIWPATQEPVPVPTLWGAKID